ncbi:MAG: group 1 glycosyl transferase [Blastocatellia bacterium AA13]|nr:MAG: group 1 glycosyl transferase [Blastocatellia bacterium AA13]
MASDLRRGRSRAPRAPQVGKERTARAGYAAARSGRSDAPRPPESCATGRADAKMTRNGSSTMRVLALVPGPYDAIPSQRFRIEQWEPFLRQRGVEIAYEPFECDELHELVYKPGRMLTKAKLIFAACARRLSALSRVHDFDAVYILREAALLGPPLIERMIARSKKPIIFDFDDAVFVPYVSPSNGYLSRLKFPSKTRTICKLASHVMAGNQFLADYALEVTDKVTIIPTTIDTARFTPSKAVEQKPIVIGWTGSHSTVQHLDTLRGALIRLAKQERFTLRVIGAPQFRIDGIDVDLRPWRAQTEVEDLRGIGIGVMPVPDERWNRGKCGLKALQYMSLGVPAVCSPTGVNSQIIRDRENGLLASTEDEWVSRLVELIRSRDLRQRLGSAGRLTVEQSYSAASQAPRVFRILESVVQGRACVTRTVPSGMLHYTEGD